MHKLLYWTCPLHADPRLEHMHVMIRLFSIVFCHVNVLGKATSFLPTGKHGLLAVINGLSWNFAIANVCACNRIEYGCAGHVLEIGDTSWK